MIMRRRRRRRGRRRKKEKEHQCTPPINFNFLLARSHPSTLHTYAHFTKHCLQQTADMRKEKAPLQCLQMVHFSFLLSLFKSGKYEVVMTPSVK
jgi:hypothetical protein